MITVFNKKKPCVADTAYIHETAVIIGDVTIGENVSIWPGVVIRADINCVTIGNGTNIQDNTVIHVDHDKPTRIGSNVTIGHAAIIHACTVGDCALIGMGATVLDGATIGDHAMVGANALVSPGTQLPSKSLSVGMPARVKRDLTAEELTALLESANHYSELAREYKKLQDGE